MLFFSIWIKFSSHYQHSITIRFHIKISISLSVITVCKCFQSLMHDKECKANANFSRNKCFLKLYLIGALQILGFQFQDRAYCYIEIHSSPTPITSEEKNQTKRDHDMQHGSHFIVRSHFKCEIYPLFWFCQLLLPMLRWQEEAQEPSSSAHPLTPKMLAVT